MTDTTALREWLEAHPALEGTAAYERVQVRLAEAATALESGANAVDSEACDVLGGTR